MTYLGDGIYQARFGYDKPNDQTVEIPFSDANNFMTRPPDETPEDWGQPEEFEPRTSRRTRAC